MTRSARALGFLVPFVLVLYLGVRSAGFDPVTYSEIGVLAWWGIALAALAGALGGRRFDRAGWWMLLLLGAFAAWTALATSWSESAEATLEEAGRVATYLGVLALALALERRGAARRTALAVGAGVAVISGLALLSRFVPDWFDPSETVQLIPGAQARLSHPLDYWNALASLIAIGLPLILWASSAGSELDRRLRAVATAVAPSIALALFLTSSRGGIIAASLAALTLLALHPARTRLLATYAAVGLGSIALIGFASTLDELQAGLQTSQASSEGLQLLAAVAAIAVLAVPARIAFEQIASSRRLAGLLARRPSGRPAVALAGAAVLAVLALGVAFDGPGEASDAFDRFKSAEDPAMNSDRFADAAGNGRWQYWSAAVDANATDPLLGIGPGTWEFWWTRAGTIDASVKDAHSLYVETLGESGIVGLLLIVGLIGGTVAIAAMRAWRARGGERAILAAILAGLVAFAFGTGIDWLWELPVLPVAFLLLSAAVVGPAVRPRTPRRAILAWIGSSAVLAAALALIVMPMLGTLAIRDSRELVIAGDLDAALAEAREARDLRPYAASGAIQEALVLERLGRLREAAGAATEATEKEETNWQTWFVLGRVEAERGRVNAAISAYETAAELNPRSPLFSGLTAAS